MVKHNQIDLIEFPVKSAEQLKQTKEFFTNVFDWKYTDWGTDYSDTTESGAKIIVDTYSFPGGRRFHFTEPNGNELAVWSK